MRLQKVVITASVLGAVGWNALPLQAADLFGWFSKDKACDTEVQYYEESGPISRLFDYDRIHNKTMPKRKARVEAWHTWHRWFLNPVVTPDNTCNFGYFETQWSRSPYEGSQFCPPGQVIESVPAGGHSVPQYPSIPASPPIQLDSPEVPTEVPTGAPPAPSFEAAPAETGMAVPLFRTGRHSLAPPQESNGVNSQTSAIPQPLRKFPTQVPQSTFPDPVTRSVPVAVVQESEMPVVLTLEELPYQGKAKAPKVEENVQHPTTVQSTTVERVGFVRLQDNRPTVVHARHGSRPGHSKPVAATGDHLGFATIEGAPRGSSEYHFLHTTVELPAFPIRRTVPRLGPVFE
ncbi:hypothetical protein KOR42_37520 [Thalassoglobus neptunius]|uniref:Uncharacterized protein n=1 Tax=Thalassoglobus neptunius TaxID=1938619 RepID=A0A5C5WGM1_9PLAN|nr:hypothetical protein [Thalassoglobus neptunius]TWT49934.1 hypothetical protein KOR42_37520 [Thalassoglobus neptunius]